MIIDFHTHAFPDKIAGRTMEMLSKIATREPETDGTFSGLIERQKKEGIDYTLSLQIATKPTQQTSVNNWAAEHQSDSIGFFGSVHPDADDWKEELYRIKELGLKGIKLHPDYQGFFINDEKMLPIYEETQKLGLPIAIHAGWDPFSPDVVHAPPKAIAEIAAAFPNLTIMAAHLGGLNRADETEEYLVGAPNVYMDISVANEFCSPEQGKRIVRKHGIERILFGTDLPWSSAEESIHFLKSLELTEEEEEMVYYRNACRLLNITAEK